jgi:hypothetical protein
VKHPEDAGTRRRVPPRKRHSTAGNDDARELPNDAIRLGEMPEPEGAHGRVDAPVGEWECLGRRDLEARRRVVARRCRHHGACDVDTGGDRPACGRPTGDVASPGGDVEEAHPRSGTDRIEERLDRALGQGAEEPFVRIGDPVPRLHFERTERGRIGRRHGVS